MVLVVRRRQADPTTAVASGRLEEWRKVVHQASQTRTLGLLLLLLLMMMMMVSTAPRVNRFW